MDINIRHAVTIGLATNRKCTDIINEIYYKDEKLYHEAYLNGGLRDDELKRIFTMKTEDMVNKLAGIIAICYDKKDFLLIEKIIQKVNPSIVKYVKNSNEVDLDKFNDKYKLVDLTEDEIFSCGISLLYLAYLNNKKITGPSFLNFIMGKWQFYLKTMLAGHQDLLSKGENEDEFIENIIKDGYSLFDTNNEIKINCNLEYFISDAIERSVYKDLGVEDYRNPSILRTINVTDYEKVRSNKFNLGVYRYIGCFSRYMHSLGLDSGDIFVDTPITNELLENMFKDFSQSIKCNNVDKDKYELYIASCLFIYNLIYLYKECKDIYLNKTAEDKYLELKEMEENLNKEKEKFKEKVSETNKAINNNKAEIKELKRKLKELEKENNKLSANAIRDKETIKRLQQDNNNANTMINELQEHIDSINSDIDIKDTSITLEDKIDYINKFNIGIFGGMTNIKSLSDKLTNVVYYNSKNQDISSINSSDAVFINTDFINHAFTNKIKSVSSKLEVPMRYISGTNNERIIDMIYKELYKIKKADE